MTWRGTGSHSVLRASPTWRVHTALPPLGACESGGEGCQHTSPGNLSLVTWQIEPLSGPLDGGTLLTIRGRNLGRRLSDVVYGVWIGSVACEPLADRYTVSEE